MKYFLHDTNAFQDEKITELFMAHGYEGLGLFYSILEKLAQQEKPVKTAVLKQQLSVGKKLEKCWSFLESLQLISSNNGETFNDNLLKFSEKYQVSKEKNREKVSQWREKQALKESVTGYVPVRNAPKVKESKVKESKSNDLQAAASPAVDLTSSLQAETPAEPRGPAEVLADEAAVFTIAGFRVFVNTIGYGKVDLGFYLPQIQYEAAKQPARPNAGPGKTWEAFVKFYLNNERKYDRLTYPAPAGGYHAGPNPALQVTTTRDDYSPAGLAARNVTRY